MRRVPVLLALLGTVLTAACDVASGPSADPLFSRQITFDEFEQTLTDGVARLEIELVPSTPTGPAVAREVEVQGADERQEEESVESNALRFENLENTSVACRGTLVLAPGFLVRFDGATTEFEAREHQDLTCAQFVERVQAVLAAGSGPVVEAERAPAAQPQAPGDASFEAQELKLEDDDGSDAPQLELNVDADNLLACSTLSGAPAGCIAVLQVLSVSIALVEGVTEFETELENAMAEAEFEGIVTAVHREGSSCRLGTVTLDDATIVELVQATQIKDESWDDEQLSDLCEVEAALAVAGAMVEAEGEGLLADMDPRTIVAAKVEFEIEEGDGPELEAEVDFEGTVTQVARAGKSCLLGSVTLSDGRVVELTASTEIDNDSGGDDQLDDLCQVEAALAAPGAVVAADGKGVRDAVDVRRILAAEVEFKVEN